MPSLSILVGMHNPPSSSSTCFSKGLNSSLKAILTMTINSHAVCTPMNYITCGDFGDFRGDFGEFRGDFGDLKKLIKKGNVNDDY